MRHKILTWLTWLCVFIMNRGSVAQYAQHIAAEPPRSPEEQQKLFDLPPGFEIQLVAAEPDIRKPMNHGGH